MRPPIENEVKLALDSLTKARARLRRLGFKISAARVFEENLVLDDGKKSLRERGLLLRVRRAGKKISCTFKGIEKPGPHKSRVEYEFKASDFDACLAIFNELGYRESFRYEKFRTEFQIPRQKGTATIDETPVGIYMELEGAARWVDRTAKALGFTRADYITGSYGQLYLDWCAEKGITPTDMRFRKRTKGAA